MGLREMVALGPCVRSQKTLKLAAAQVTAELGKHALVDDKVGNSAVLEVVNIGTAVRSAEVGKDRQAYPLRRDDQQQQQRTRCQWPSGQCRPCAVKAIPQSALGYVSRARRV